MKDWNSFPMLRLLVPFLAGVVSWAFLLERIDFNPEFLVWGIVVGAVAVTALAGFGFIKRKPHFFGLTLGPILYLLGSLLTISVSDFVYPDYLESSTDDQPKTFIAVVDDQPKVKKNSVEVVVNLTDKDRNEFGKALLYFEVDSAGPELKYHDELVLRTNLQRVLPLGNPNEFKYDRYLRFHDILYRGYVKSEDWELLARGKPSIIGMFLDVRSFLIGKLEEGGLTGNELSVASALILGYRADLDRELMNAYAGAGATHVLAVSGLHVGIVYFILNLLLRFLDRHRYGVILRLMLLVGFLWAYAALTGLSPSVCRAATMFTFVALGKAVDRNTNIFNALAVSAFCLIAYQPMIVMQVGFQLSYLAVIGIVVIQPRLLNLLVIENRLLDWAWSITCVSFAAQIATFPLGLLYFHQFPNLFPISNLLVIPAATFILWLGFVLFGLCWCPPALSVFGYLLKNLIYGLNYVVVKIEQIPYSVLSGIDISTFESLLIYALIFGVLIFVVKQNRFGLYSSLVLAVLLMVLQCIEVYEQKNQRFVTVYNVRKETAIAFVYGNEVTFLARKEFWKNESAMLFHIRHHWWNKGLQSEKFIELTDSLFNRELYWDYKRIAILNLEGKDRIDLTFNDSLDLILVNKIDWPQIEKLNFLKARNVIVSNTIGPKTKERLKGVPEFNCVFVADEGAVIF